MGVIPIPAYYFHYANEALFQFTHRIGKRINSRLIIANAWHHRSDAASSLVVLIGLIGSLYGYVIFDVVAAIIVGLMIVKMGCEYGWRSVKELIDTAVELELLNQIEELIQNTPGVKKIHQLRSRYMGENVLIDVHIQVSPKISVSEGHYIAQHVHQALVNQIESISDVTVHVDPEDDEDNAPSLHLPERAVLEQQLFDALHIDFPDILFCNLHYLNGCISIDIACAQGFSQWSQLRDRIQVALTVQSDISEVRLFNLHEIMVS